RAGHGHGGSRRPHSGPCAGRNCRRANVLFRLVADDGASGTGNALAGVGTGAVRAVAAIKVARPRRRRRQRSHCHQNSPEPPHSADYPLIEKSLQAVDLYERDAYRVSASEGVDLHTGPCPTMRAPARSNRRPPGFNSMTDRTATAEAAPASSPLRPKGKLFIETHGCQMNEYDSAKMADVLAASDGLELTTIVEEADVILVNTCSIREKAQEKVFSRLGRWKALKKDGKPVLIGVGGCVASQEGAAIVKRAPYVDLVFGPQTLHRLPELLRDRRETGLPQVDISFPEIEKFDRLPEPRADGPTAFVSIMEGCSKYCSFCVVPYTRGEEVSRPFDDVLVEVSQLAAQGVREVNLLGQNVNAYRGAMFDTDDKADLALLIRAIAQIQCIGRIRYTTSHPLEFSDSLIEAHRDVPQLASYLH